MVNSLHKRSKFGSFLQSNHLGATEYGLHLSIKCIELALRQKSDLGEKSK